MEVETGATSPEPETCPVVKKVKVSCNDEGGKNAEAVVCNGDTAKVNGNGLEDSNGDCDSMDCADDEQSVSNDENSSPCNDDADVNGTVNGSSQEGEEHESSSNDCEMMPSNDSPKTDSADTHCDKNDNCDKTEKGNTEDSKDSTDTRDSTQKDDENSSSNQGDELGSTEGKDTPKGNKEASAKKDTLKDGDDNTMLVNGDKVMPQKLNSESDQNSNADGKPEQSTESTEVTPSSEKNTKRNDASQASTKDLDHTKVNDKSGVKNTKDTTGSTSSKKATALQTELTKTKNDDVEVQKESRLVKLMENKDIDNTDNMRPMASLLFGIGLDLARQQIFKDLIRVQTKRQSQKKLGEKEEDQLDKLKGAFDTIVSKNDNYTKPSVTCVLCNFKTEARNVLEWHKEFAHDQEMGRYACSFCDFQDRSPGNFFFHMEAEHNRKGRVYMRQAFFTCSLCPYESNSKHSLMKHRTKCDKTFKLKRNLEPSPTDCDIPLKRVKKILPPAKKPQPIQAMPQGRKVSILPPATLPSGSSSLGPRFSLVPARPTVSELLSRPGVQRSLPPPPPPQQRHPNFQVQHPMPGVQQYSIGGGMYTLINNRGQIIMQPAGMPPVTLSTSALPNMQSALQQQLTMNMALASQASRSRSSGQRTTIPQPPPLQRAPVQNRPVIVPLKTAAKQGTVAVQLAKKSASNTPQAKSSSPQFEICEICGGFVKDRESLRIHFYWAHKVDIHKDIFSQSVPHLSCEVCTQRFWTYQGLARHRLITHSKQQSQKKYHCQICGKGDITQLLNHLHTVHNITLSKMFRQKKCLCCGMMFQQEKSLERHMMQAHSELFKNVVPATSTTQAKSPSPAKGGGKGVNPIPTGLFENAASKKKFEPVCSICNITFPSLDVFSEHCNRLHIFKCHRCGQKWSTEEMLKKHIFDVHKNEKEPCELCNEKVVIGRPHIRHMKRCHLRNCSVVIKRLKKSLFELHMKRREASLKLNQVSIVVTKSKTPTPSLPKPVRSNEVIVIIDDESDTPQNTPKKKPAIPKDDKKEKKSDAPSQSESNKVSSSEKEKAATQSKTVPVEKEKSSPPPNTSEPGSPVAEIVEEVLEIDGEKFVIKKQDDEDCVNEKNASDKSGIETEKQSGDEKDKDPEKTESTDDVKSGSDCKESGDTVEKPVESEKSSEDQEEVMDTD